MDQNLNVRVETIKHLKKQISQTLSKLKTFVPQKNDHESKKITFRMGENMCKSYTDNDLVSKIHKELW